MQTSSHVSSRCCFDILLVADAQHYRVGHFRTICCCSQGHKLEAYLPEIVALLVCLLEGATASLPNEMPAESLDIIPPVAEQETHAALNGSSNASKTEVEDSDLEADTEEQVQGEEVAAEKVQEQNTSA